MRILHLTLKKKWFDMIANGEKLEEYREIKPYWASRLLSFENEMEFASFDEMVDDMQNPYQRHDGIDDLMKCFRVSFRKFDAVCFRNGYSKHAPTVVKYMDGITVAAGFPEWGAEHGRFYFVLRIGKVLEMAG